VSWTRVQDGLYKVNEGVVRQTSINTTTSTLHRTPTYTAVHSYARGLIRCAGLINRTHHDNTPAMHQSHNNGTAPAAAGIAPAPANGAPSDAPVDAVSAPQSTSPLPSPPESTIKPHSERTSVLPSGTPSASETKLPPADSPAPETLPPSTTTTKDPGCAEKDSLSEKAPIADPEAAPVSASPPPARYSAFSRREKHIIIAVAGYAAWFSTLSSTIYFPALDQLADSLRVSVDRVNLTITSYMAVAAIAPTLVGDFADVMGRRPAYVACLALYVVANVAIALAKSWGALLGLRVLQALAISGVWGHDDAGVDFRHKATNTHGGRHLLSRLRRGNRYSHARRARVFCERRFVWVSLSVQGARMF
jgi:hypothetical protein